jgi:hypothetical protein
MHMTWKPLSNDDDFFFFQRRFQKDKTSWKELANTLRAEEGQTIIHCRYVSKKKYLKGGWVNIFRTTYLYGPDGQERIFLAQALNIPYAPAKHFFKKVGELKCFTLVFPLLPKHWEWFSLREQPDNGDGFVYRKIMRNESGVYQIDIH